MDYEDYKREEQLKEHARQFGALHDLGMDAAALAAGERPDVAQQAEELRGAAEVLGPQYAVMSPALRGVALARMLAVVARLFELGQSLARRPPAPAPGGEDDLLFHLPELLPQIRGCAKFLSDEIAAYALYLVQEEESTKAAAAVTFRRDCSLAEQVSDDRRLAQSIHDRDTAYAASRAHLHPPGAPAAAGPGPARDLEYGADPWDGSEADEYGAEDQAFDPALDGWGLGEYPAEDEGEDAEEAAAALADDELALLTESRVKADFVETAAERGTRDRITQYVVAAAEAHAEASAEAETAEAAEAEAAAEAAAAAEAEAFLDLAILYAAEAAGSRRKAGGPAGPQ